MHSRQGMQSMTRRRDHAPAAEPRPRRISCSAGAVPPSPPADVLEAIGVAAAAWERLQQDERTIHFALRPSGGLTIELCDAAGAVLDTLSPRQVLSVAGGDPVA